MIVILSGVAGAGKDTIKREIMNRMDYVETFASYTSRAQRAGDIPGETYNFVSKKEFEEMIKQNAFYEYDIHHNNYYGIARKSLNEKMQNGKVIIKDVDVNGTQNLIDLLKEGTKIITIFLRVPKEQLEKRLKERVENPSPEEIKLRLNRFDYEESKIGLYDYVLKNNDLEKTVQIIMTIIENELKLENPEF